VNLFLDFTEKIYFFSPNHFQVNYRKEKNKALHFSGGSREEPGGPGPLLIFRPK